MTHPTVRTPSEGRTIAIVGDIYRFLATGEETDGKYTLFEATVCPGGGPPPHVHSREEEGFYILEGQITLFIDGKSVVAKPDTFANVPIGVPHSFKNETNHSARMLITLAPAGLEHMFFEAGTQVPQGTTSTPLPTKEEVEKLMSVAPKYGVEILVPKH